MNEYGFLKEKCIQGCVVGGPLNNYSNVTIQGGDNWLKMDFEKTFDKIEHCTILEILKARGFATEWINWINLI
jgi:hypothetical protein